jgi:hypothetical protein
MPIYLVILSPTPDSKYLMKRTAENICPPIDRESAISFYDEYQGKNHIYIVDPEIVKLWNPDYPATLDYVSTTTLIKSFFPSFDADAVIQKLQMNGVPKYTNVDPQEIKDEWDEIRNVASFRGTRMHEFFEKILKGEALPDDLDTIPIEDKMHVDKNGLTCELACQLLREEISKPISMYKNIASFHVFKSEWRLFDESLYICGTVDCVLVNPKNQNELVVIDWKRSKAIKKENIYGEKGNHPLTSMLDNCNFNHYALQLNIYKRLIETTYPPMKVIEMFIININSTTKKCEIFPIRPMENMVHAMFIESYNLRVKEKIRSLSQ